MASTSSFANSAAAQGSGDTERHGSSDELEEVRNILFGQQMRAQAEALAAMRAQLAEQLGAQQKAAAEAIRQISESVKTGLAQVTQAQEADRRAFSGRGDELAAMVIGLRETHEVFAAKAGEASAGMAKQHEESFGAIEQRIRDTNDQMSAEMKNLATDLDDRKTDRQALAKVLHDLADGLV